MCKDIEDAYPCSGHKKSRRHTDPLAPEYEMPGWRQTKHLPGFVPRQSQGFTNYNGDIEFSQPRKLHKTRNYIKNPNDISDIEYSQPHYFSRTLAHQKYKNGRQWNGEQYRGILYRIVV